MTWFSMSASRTGGSNAGPTDGSDLVPDGSRAARILVVEDDFLIALELEHRLTDAGFEVVGIAVTAGEAISMAGLENPELAIVDIRLADRSDGVEAATVLFETLGIRSIFASAHADAETRKRAAAASPIGWLQKPYSAEALLRLVRGYLSE